MKILVAGVQRRSGKSKEGRDYDMAQLFGLMPIQARSSQNSQHTTGGYHALEFQCNPQFAQSIMNEKFPQEMILSVEPRQGQNGVETYITGKQG